jgi:hypothetical protein
MVINDEETLHSIIEDVYIVCLLVNCIAFIQSSTRISIHELNHHHSFFELAYPTMRNKMPKISLKGCYCETAWRLLELALIYSSHADSLLFILISIINITLQLV